MRKKICDWSEVFNGQEFTFTAKMLKGRKIKSVIGSAYQAATLRGLRLTTRVEGDCLIVKATTKFKLLVPKKAN